MAKSKLLCVLMTMVSLVKPSLLDSGSGTEAFTQLVLAPPGTFAMPDPSSDKVISRNPDDVSFLLYSSPNDTNKYDEIKYGDPDSASKLSKSKPVKFIVHGFCQDATTNFPRFVKDAYLAALGEDCNIIVMDWGKLATPNIDLPGGLAFYPDAVKNVKTAGNRLGEFAAWLQRLDKLDHTSTHIIGHSLGAHIGGMAGETFSHLIGHKLARLSGLDPAGPLFETGAVGRTIRSTDAEFVDCYHTGKGGLGINQDTGTTDFWINNGGPIQPGCLPDIGGFCSHGYSCEVWRQSIINSTRTAGSSKFACTSGNLAPIFPSNSCKDVKFGESATAETKWTYFVTT